MITTRNKERTDLSQKGIRGLRDAQETPLPTPAEGLKTANPDNANGPQALDDEIKQAQTHRSNIINYNGATVAIACHICGANAARDRVDDANPHLSFLGLHAHYKQSHKDHPDVKDKDWTQEDTTFMCQKYSIPAAEFKLIARGGQPTSPAFVPKPGESEITCKVVPR